MNINTTVIIGILAVLFGAATIILRLTRPQMFKKLVAMKSRFGDKLGYAIHFIAYSIIPITFGIVIFIKANTDENLRRNEVIIQNIIKLSAAANQFYLERGEMAVTLDELVGEGPNNISYIRKIIPVNGETYPTIFRANEPIVVTLKDGTALRLP